MKNLYALLVGINNYPIDSHKLNGCINDRDAINDFFKNYCETSDLNYQPLLLSDEGATRQGIIDGFAHFKEAKQGDLCVFYFSGHGSQMIAPKEFWRDETDQRCETLVCHDSRIGQGRDLSDKELSYLIWKYTHNKDVHFLATFDCCHAGTITRSVEMVHRMADLNTTPVFAKRFEGVEFYKSHEGQLIPPESNHIALSASRSYESSVELTLGGQRRGLFTYSLIDVLNQTDLTTLSYSALMSKVQTRVHSRIDTQHPQVNAQGNASVKELFLDGNLKTNPSYIIKHNEKKGWIIDLGTMHGLNANVNIQVEHGNEIKSISLKSIGTAQSNIRQEDWMNTSDKFYTIKEISGLRKKLKVAFYPKLANPQAKQHISDMVKDWNIEYIDTPDQAAYWMRLTDNGYILTRPHDNRPVFKAIAEDSGEELFLQNVNKVAKWEEVSQLTNPLAKGAAEQELKIDFFNVTDHDDYLKVNQEEAMDINGDAVFRYAYNDGKWENPNLRMSVKNTSDRSLWVGALFMGEDYVITDYFMPVKELRPNEQPYALTAVNQEGIRVNVVPIFVPNELHSWGETEISNQIKIIASATPFSMEAYLQEGLKLEIKDPTRGATSRGMGFGTTQPSTPKMPTKPEWFTKDIIYKIHRSQDVKEAVVGKTMILHNLTIEGHDSFSAKRIRLTSSKNEMQGASRSVQRPSIQDALGSDNFLPVNIASGSRSIQHGLDTLELHDVEGKENITAENPLRLKIDLPLENNESIFPFGYDAETNSFYPLGYPEDDVIKVESLADAEEVVTRGLGRSFKIYLQKVVYQKIFKKEFPFPVLAAATVDEHHNVSYENDYDVIKSKVQNPATQRIVIFIHGIIGDTKDQVKLVRRAVRNEGGIKKDLTDHYDLILTFDYESLNDPIETTAENLKKRLEQIGLIEGHNKSLHIIAHSMGGLVSRWFIEKLDGDKIVTHFIQVGSPNAGSPWAKAYHMGVFGLTKLINFLPIPSTINSVLSFIGKKRKNIEVTVRQLQPDSDFCKKLNSGNSNVSIPYTVIAGDSSLIPNRQQEATLFKKMLNRYSSEYRKKLIKLFFHDRSDDIVAVASCHGIPEENSKNVTTVDSVGCNHFTYFNTDDGVKALAKVLFELK